ncbi:mechanosensitive ion channel [Myroides sp. M-43]|uniref:mechanosensitive ion channel family protein n=1 Tax=Myroides oncorhynchi TaxID=2893756 RepID=UPI001E2DAA2A|nr:mechanosensitive ion channel domain-containing protein [Myroides oncorhynchi]MCC9042678.1 mechanosensitive ion channel [Myroides oncorhynchi]
MQKLDNLLTKYIENFFAYIPEIVTSLIILALGMWLIRFLQKLAKKIFLKKDIDPTFSSFILDVLIWGLRILLFIIIASKLGIQTSSFVAIIGAMSLAIGLSLQGSLSNFAGGVLIILFKPFKIGDIIEAQGESGKVLTIHIFSTQILTYQNNIVYIPNGVLSNGKIKNISQNNLRRAEIAVQTTLVKNTNQFIERLQEELDNYDKVLSQPKPRILIKELLDTKITYNVQVWVEHDNYNIVCSYILLKAREISDSI